METQTAQTLKIQHRRVKIVTKYGIQLPKLPKQLPSVGIEAVTDDALNEQLLFSGIHLDDQSAADLIFEQCLFRRVSFLQTQMTNIRLDNCRLEMCDLSGAAWTNARLRRVEITGSRLLGSMLAEGTFEDMFFKDCPAERANFTWASFRSVRFEKCDLRGSIFIGADLKSAVFHQCNLTGADMREASLAGADFRTSTIDRLNVGVNELKGVVISPPQALQVMGLLGIQVKEVDEE